MNVAVNHGARRAIATQVAASFRLNDPAIASRRNFGSRIEPWTCPDCTIARRPIVTGWRRDNSLSQRYISSSIRRLDEARKPINPPTSTRSTTEPDEEHETLTHDTVASLPSTTDKRRWQTPKRLGKIIDSILARASIAGHHINIYTGTDYSGVDAIKKQIIRQEENVRECHDEIETARATHRSAHDKQTMDQKEIVSLLERKSSWSPADLERYMSLVRAEHTNESAVQEAKNGLDSAERELETCRGLLERLERRQYHEEQIWSDTIRRNSTWVTFGLMGLNIFLLLAQIAIFEPWRRRRIVKEVNQALEDKSFVGKIAEEVVEVRSHIEERAEKARISERPIEGLVEGRQPGTTPLAAGELLPEEAMKISDQTSLPEAVRQSKRPETWSEQYELYMENLRDLFSERLVQVRKVELTNLALQGAATGVATMGLLFVLWRPK